ncbi:MAG: hypothetical protein WDO71_20375, partial [Bacteroidota bacterium]
SVERVFKENPWKPAPGVTVTGSKPVEEIVSLEPSLILMLKLPPASALVAFCVPVSRMVAKAIGSPLSSPYLTGHSSGLSKC